MQQRSSEGELQQNHREKKISRLLTEESIFFDYYCRLKECKDCGLYLLKAPLFCPFHLQGFLEMGEEEGDRFRGGIRLFTIWLSWALCGVQHLILSIN